MGGSPTKPGGRVKGGVTAPRGGIRLDQLEARGGVGPPKRYPGGVDPKGVGTGVDDGDSNGLEWGGVLLDLKVGMWLL